MAEYYKIPAHSLPHQAAGTTEADREAADRDLWERVAKLEKSPVLPALPTTAGDYKLTVTVSGSTKTYTWTTIEAAAE